jgi:hypothetical protein
MNAAFHRPLECFGTLLVRGAAKVSDYQGTSAGYERRHNASPMANKGG